MTTGEKGTPKTQNKGSLPVEKRKAVNKALAPSSLGDTIKTNQTIKDLNKVEVLPQFEGGMKGWTEYLQSNLKYPAETKKN